MPRSVRGSKVEEKRRAIEFEFEFEGAGIKESSFFGRVRV